LAGGRKNLSKEKKIWWGGEVSRLGKWEVVGFGVGLRRMMVLREEVRFEESLNATQGKKGKRERRGVEKKGGEEESKKVLKIREQTGKHHSFAAGCFARRANEKKRLEEEKDRKRNAAQ